jgi:hypothetical protein
VSLKEIPSMNRNRSHRKRLASHLVGALDHVTAALIAVDGLTTDPPDEALDEILGQHHSVGRARQVVRKRLKAVLAMIRGEDGRRAVLDLESAYNALSVTMTDVGYRVGTLNGWVAGRVERRLARASRPGGKLASKAEK